MNRHQRNLGLDTVLGVAFVLVILSGLTLWLTGPGTSPLGLPGREWRAIHTLMSTVLLAATALHLAWHRTWIRSVLLGTSRAGKVRLRAWTAAALLGTFLWALISGPDPGGIDGLPSWSPAPWHVVAGLAMGAVTVLHVTGRRTWVRAVLHPHPKAASTRPLGSRTEPFDSGAAQSGLTARPMACDELDFKQS